MSLTNEELEKYEKEVRVDVDEAVRTNAFLCGRIGNVNAFALQLEDIQRHMQFTREHIDMLNDRFANQTPSSIYLLVSVG